jgi:hypothetical protein
MHDGAVFWMTLLAVFGTCFFAIAAYVAVTGVADLRALLRRPGDGPDGPGPAAPR